MSDERKNSYTAADALPIKVIKNTRLINEIIHDKKIRPIHPQFIPTNKCNLNCPFCSCAEDDRMTEMPFEDAKKILDTLFDLGSKAITITGGGEPLIYPHINELINYCYDLGIKVGLVTNGLKLDNLDCKNGAITWCRISNGDFRSMSDAYRNKLDAIVKKYPEIDWAFSHVVSSKPNYVEIEKILQYAKDHNFTHVRLVADLFEPENVPLDSIKDYFKMKNFDDSIAIYQGRKNPVHGQGCYICYLKPLIGPDQKVYMCCGVQYALEDDQKKLPEKLCLGYAKDLPKIIENSYKPGPGHQCVKCYYSDYNSLLENLLKETNHGDFL